LTYIRFRTRPELSRVRYIWRLHAKDQHDISQNDYHQNGLSWFMYSSA
jgi:hypothetical protein